MLLQQPHQRQEGEQLEQQRLLHRTLEELPDPLLQLRLLLLLHVLFILHLWLRPLLPTRDAGVHAGQRLQLRFKGEQLVSSSILARFSVLVNNKHTLTS